MVAMFRTVSGCSYSRDADIAEALDRVYVST